MIPAEPPAEEQEPRGLSWGEKVLKLNEALDRRGIPYAFGGAIALNFHREPRATVDIDFNVFLSPEDEAETIDALSELFSIDREKLVAGIRRDAQARTFWGRTQVDLFFSDTPFHNSMAGRIERRPFEGVEIPVISIEDLLVAKVLYGRDKDWLDVDAVVATEGDRLDGDYIRHWVGEFLDSRDPRLTRLNQAIPDESEGPGH